MPLNLSSLPERFLYILTRLGTPSSHCRSAWRHYHKACIYPALLPLPSILMSALSLAVGTECKMTAPTILNHSMMLNQGLGLEESCFGFSRVTGRKQYSTTEYTWFKLSNHVWHCSVILSKPPPQPPWHKWQYCLCVLSRFITQLRLLFWS